MLVERWFDLKKRKVDVSIEDICRDAPHLKDKLEREIQAIIAMDGLLGDEARTVWSQQTSISNLPSNPIDQRLGQRVGNSESKSVYEIQRLLATGGCSEVYVANDLSLGRKVAIKFLRPDLENVATYQQRLDREAKITGRLDHPGIVSIHSQGTDRSGLPFYTMRLIEGESLAKAIKDFHSDSNADLTNRRWESSEFRRLLTHFVDTCQAIAFAHSKDVIHRDLKPDNIVTGTFGETYVVDWGLARYLEGDDITVMESGRSQSQGEASSTEESNNLTRLGNVIGTPSYMSPEQAEGCRASKSSDVYGLGATLYAIITGNAPFRGSSVIDVIKLARQTRFPPISECQPTVPKRLIAICEKAMRSDSEKRYESAIELADDVESFLADQPVTAFPDPPIDKIRRWLKRNRVAVTAGISTVFAALLILIGVSTYLVDANRSLSESEAEANLQRENARRALEEATENLYSQRISLAYSELDKNNIVRATDLLNECPEDRREWEWKYLNWVVNRNRPFKTLPDGILKFANTGNLAVISSWDRPNQPSTLTFWNTLTWSKLHSIELQDAIYDLDFDSRGKRLAVVGTGRNSDGKRVGVVKIIQVDSGDVLVNKYAHSGLATCVAWSKDDSRIVTGGRRGSVRIRNQATLQPRGEDYGALGKSEQSSILG